MAKTSGENRLMFCTANMFCAVCIINTTHGSQWEKTEDDISYLIQFILLEGVDLFTNYTHMRSDPYFL